MNESIDCCVDTEICLHYIYTLKIKTLIHKDTHFLVRIVYWTGGGIGIILTDYIALSDVDFGTYSSLEYAQYHIELSNLSIDACILWSSVSYCYYFCIYSFCLHDELLAS